MIDLKQLIEGAGKQFLAKRLCPSIPPQVPYVKSKDGVHVDSLEILMPTNIVARGHDEADAEKEFEALFSMFLERQHVGSTIAWRDDPKTRADDGPYFCSMDVVVVSPSEPREERYCGPSYGPLTRRLINGK